MKIILTLLLLSPLVSNLSLVAQDAATVTAGQESHQVVVHVRAKGNGRDIKRAEVRIDTKTYFTDASGLITLSVASQAVGKIMISKVGYDKVLLDTSQLLATDRYDVYLYPAEPSDNEVLIRGEKRPDVSKKTLSVEESRRVAPNDDPAQVTKLLPGVQTAAFGSDIAVRGSAPEDSRYFVDHYQVPSVFHSISDLSVIPEQLIEDLDFYAGGFGAQYGDATGGVVTIHTKSDIPEQARTDVKVNLPFYSAVYHERPLSETSMIAGSLRYSYLQYLLPILLPKDLDATVVPYFGDAHVFYLQKHEDGSYTKIFTMGSQDGIELVYNGPESTQSDGKEAINFYRGFATVGAQHYKPLGEGWSLDVSPQLIYDKADATLSTYSLAWDFYQARVFAELSKRLSKREYFYVGIEPEYGVFKANITAPVPSDDPLYDYEDADTQTLKRDLPYFTVAAWTSIDRQMASFIATPGLRVYYDDQIHESGVDPRLSGRWLINDEHLAKGSIGLYSHAPELRESNDEFGSSDLDFERSIHYVLGWEGKWSDRWESDIQIYYKDLYDLVVDDAVNTYSNAGQGRSWGSELFLRRNLTEKMFGWLSYTFSQTQVRDAAQDGWRSSAYDQTHVAILAGCYKVGAQWDVGSRIKYHTGDTYTPITDSAYNASLDKYQPRPKETDRLSRRLKNYHQIDVFTTVNFLMDESKLALRLGVNYFALNKQVYGKTNNYDYSKEEDFSSVPPIPFIELKGEF